MLRLASCLVGMVLCAVMPTVSAQSFPSKGIRVVVAYPPAGFTDEIGRILVKNFNDGFAQGSYVDNRPGAGTVIGTEVVTRSAPDGYTLLVTGLPLAVIKSLYPNVTLDVVKDLSPIVHAGSTASLLVVNSAATPYKTVKDLIGAAKAKPASVVYASTGNGSSAHLFMELFKLLTKTSIVHVPYKGNGPAMTALLGREIPLMFANFPNGLPHVTSGKLRALGVTTNKRVRSLPDVPTMAEAGVPDFEASVWWAVLSPARMPGDVIAKLNTEINRIFSLSEVRKLYQDQGVEVGGGTSEWLATYVREQMNLWSKVVKEANIKAE
jgi:tripartite-type tricarboxylate transporter receptor subunit TctC